MRTRRSRSSRSTSPTSTSAKTSALSLRADQAEADTRVAPGRGRRPPRHGRRRRAGKIARIEESRAKLVDAEAEVPKAMADAFRSGRLGILDYYKLRNVQADTNMREPSRAAGRGRDKATRDNDMTKPKDEVEEFLRAWPDAGPGSGAAAARAAEAAQTASGRQPACSLSSTATSSRPSLAPVKAEVVDAELAEIPRSRRPTRRPGPQRRRSRSPSTRGI